MNTLYIWAGISPFFELESKGGRENTFALFLSLRTRTLIFLTERNEISISPSRPSLRILLEGPATQPANVRMSIWVTTTICLHCICSVLVSLEGSHQVCRVRLHVLLLFLFESPPETVDKFFRVHDEEEDESHHECHTDHHSQLLHGQQSLCLKQSKIFFKTYYYE